MQFSNLWLSLCLLRWLSPNLSLVYNFNPNGLWILYIGAAKGWIHLRLNWRLSMILKTSSKSVWSNAFWYIEVCIFWKCIQYTMNWDKTQILKKIPSFFFHELQLLTVLLLLWDSYMSWSTRLISLKPCVGFSIFKSVLSLLKFVFLFNKMHGLFDFKMS